QTDAKDSVRCAKHSRGERRSIRRPTERRGPDQHEVGTRCASATPCGIAPWTKPRHSTAPLGFPGSAITSEESTIAARLRDKIEFGVIFIDSARITSPKPGSSTRI